MNNKIVSTKRTSAIFLAIVLVTGTIVLSSSSSSFMINTQAQPYYNGMDNNDRKSYGNDNYKSQKDSSNINLNKIKCINDNINVNGENAGDINVGNKGQGPTANAEEGYYDGYNNNKKGKGFDDCIINNNNTNTNIVGGGGNVTDGGGNQTIPPEPLTATLNVSKVIECFPFQTLPNYLAACDRILNEVTPNQFNIIVSGNNPNPSQFDASSVGTIVRISPGDYELSETTDPSLSTTLTDISNDLGVIIQDRNVSYFGDCELIREGVGNGTIAEGESQDCRVFNEILVGIENG